MRNPSKIDSLESAVSVGITVAEFSCGDRNYDDEGVDLVTVIRAYCDDSGDEKRKRFASCGGLIGHPLAWQEFDKRWSVATYELKGAFHATDCDTNPPRGIFKGWPKDKADRLMKELVEIVLETKVMCFASIVPIPEYRELFPGSGEHDPYLLALKHTLVNMARIGAHLADEYYESVGMKVWVENGDVSTQSFQIFNDMKSLATWSDAQYLQGFAVGTKDLYSLQGADLIAREAFKHADNLGVRRIRKPVKAMKMISSFHLWNRQCLEYLKINGGPDNLTLLTEWADKPLLGVPVMTHFYKDGFR